MLWILFIVLLVLWLLGVVSNSLGWFVHILLVLAVVALVFQLLTGRSRTTV